MGINPSLGLYVAPAWLQWQGWLKKFLIQHISAASHRDPALSRHIPHQETSPNPAVWSHPSWYLHKKGAGAALACWQRDGFWWSPPFLPPSRVNPVTAKGQMNPWWSSMDWLGILLHQKKQIGCECSGLQQTSCGYRGSFLWDFCLNISICSFLAGWNIPLFHRKKPEGIQAGGEGSASTELSHRISLPTWKNPNCSIGVSGNHLQLFGAVAATKVWFIIYFNLRYFSFRKVHAVCILYCLWSSSAKEVQQMKGDCCVLFLISPLILTF